LYFNGNRFNNQRATGNTFCANSKRNGSTNVQRCYGTITVTVPANGAGVSYTVTGTSPVVAAQAMPLEFSQG